MAAHRDGSFEYLQHMFWLRNKKNDFQNPSLICMEAGSLLNFFQSDEVLKVLMEWQIV